MSSVKISTPTQDEINQHPREFALLAQLPGYHSGSVSAKDLEGYAERYGSGKQSFSGEASFADIAKAFKKKTQNKAGNGNTAAWVVKEASAAFEPYSVDRRPCSDEDIRIQITYAGICHSDLHQVRAEWGDTIFPMVPGHEIIGVVTNVGKSVNKFKVGDRAGVGCFVDSCRKCQQCHENEEQFCEEGMIATYAGKHPRYDNAVTYGGYSTAVVVAESYALRIPENLDMASSAPLLCAGITTYAPLVHYGLNTPGKKVGVLGMGGLGHMAVKIAKAMGTEVTVISTSEKKRKTALEMGADHFVVSKDDKAMLAVANSLDGIIDTVSAEHSIEQALSLIKKDGTLALVGVPPKPHQFAAFAVLSPRKKIGGSMIGGIKETQEMLDFCGKHGITCEVETIGIDYLNKAYERLADNDVHYRFSIDIQGTLID